MAHENESVSAQGTQDAEPPTSRLAAAVFPIVFGLTIAVVAVGAVVVVLLFNRVGDLEDENRTLGSVVEANILQLRQSVIQQQTISYWLAYPGPQTLVLDTPFEGGTAQGLLKPAEAGLSAILLVAGLGELPPSSTYDIWLTEGSRTVHAGEIGLDAAGWGTSTVYFDEPLNTFETVELTLRVQENVGSRAGAGPVVLEGSIR